MKTIGDTINDTINEFLRQQKEYTEKALTEIITKYDFVVGSTELKHKLMEILPEGANIISSPFIEDPTKVYAIKKFDATDLFKGFHLPDINSGKLSEIPTGSESEKTDADSN